VVRGQYDDGRSHCKERDKQIDTEHSNFNIISISIHVSISRCHHQASFRTFLKEYTNCTTGIEITFLTQYILNFCLYFQTLTQHRAQHTLTCCQYTHHTYDMLPVHTPYLCMLPVHTPYLRYAASTHTILMTCCQYTHHTYVCCQYTHHTYVCCQYTHHTYDMLPVHTPYLCMLPVHTPYL